MRTINLDDFDAVSITREMAREMVQTLVSEGVSALERRYDHISPSILQRVVSGMVHPDISVGDGHHVNLAGLSRSLLTVPWDKTLNSGRVQEAASASSLM